MWTDFIDWLSEPQITRPDCGRYRGEPLRAHDSKLNSRPAQSAPPSVRCSSILSIHLTNSLLSLPSKWTAGSIIVDSVVVDHTVRMQTQTAPFTGTVTLELPLGISIPLGHFVIVGKSN